MLEQVQSGPFDHSDLDGHISRGEVIVQMEDQSDVEFPEICWCRYGIVPTNSIAVTARCGAVTFYAQARSWLDAPSMANRIFGTDVLDARLGGELSARLWELYGEELTKLALDQRSSKGG